MYSISQAGFVMFEPSIARVPLYSRDGYAAMAGTLTDQRRRTMRRQHRVTRASQAAGLGYSDISSDA